MTGFENAKKFDLQKSIIIYKTALLKIHLIEQHQLQIDEELQKENLDKEIEDCLIHSKINLKIEKNIAMHRELSQSIEYFKKIGYDYSNIKSYKIEENQ